jgi:hypothetical protein
VHSQNFSMSSSFSPSRSLGSSRLQLGVGGVSRLRSSSLKKPPEPQGRAVADCLFSSAAASGTSAATPHHGRPPRPRSSPKLLELCWFVICVNLSLIWLGAVWIVAMDFDVLCVCEFFCLIGCSVGLSSRFVPWLVTEKINQAGGHRRGSQGLGFAGIVHRNR